MASLLDMAVEKLAARISAGDFDGVAKFVLEGQGAIMVDEAGVRAGDEEADVTLTATPDVFQALLSGSLSPMQAYMAGKLRVDGALPMAMKLGQVLA